MASDPMLGLIGEGGLYQLFAAFLLCLINMSVNIEQMYVNFLTPHVEHVCNVPQLQHLSFEQQKALAVPRNPITNASDFCSVISRDWSDFLQNNPMSNDSNSDDFTIESCKNGYIFDESIYHSSATSQWDLVCDNAWILEIISPIYACGLVLGSVLSGNVADTMGRKMCMLIFLGLHMLGALGVALSFNVWMMLMSRVMIAISIRGAGLSAMILLMEISPSKYREAASVSFYVFYCCGTLLLSGVATLVRDFRLLQLAIALPFSLCLTYYWLIPESPVWLVSKGLHEKAVTEVKKIIKYNRKTIPDDMLNEYSQRKVDKIEIAIEESPALEPVGYSALIKNKIILSYAVTLSVALSTSFIVYMGTSFNLSQLSGNIYENLLLSAGLEIPVVTSLMLLLPKIGRRPVIVCAFLLMATTSFSSIVLHYIGDMEMIVTFLSLSSRMFACCGSTTICIYLSELFPTALRQRASGVVNACAGLATMLAPTIGGTLRVVWEPLPNIIYGSMAIISTIFIIVFLPETKGKPLPETIEQAVNLKKIKENTRTRSISNAKPAESAILNAGTIGRFQMLFTGEIAVTIDRPFMRTGSQRESKRSNASTEENSV